LLDGKLDVAGRGLNAAAVPGRVGGAGGDFEEHGT